MQDGTWKEMAKHFSLIVLFWTAIIFGAIGLSLLAGCKATAPKSEPDQIDVRVQQVRITSYQIDGNMLVLNLEDGNIMRIYPSRADLLLEDVDLTVEFDK